MRDTGESAHSPAGLHARPIKRVPDAVSDAVSTMAQSTGPASAKVGLLATPDDGTRAMAYLPSPRGGWARGPRPILLQ